MAYYVKSIVVPGSLEASFEYLADFSNAAEWDPGVAEAERISQGPLEVGSAFRVVASFFGRDVELVYRVARLEPPKRIVLEADGPGLRSVDSISFEPEGAGTRINYHADLQLRGWRRALDPLLQIGLAWVAWDAMRGLQAKLGRVRA